MIETCENCPKFANCTTLCKKADELLEPVVEDIPGITESKIDKRRSSYDEKNEGRGTIDNLFRIDSGRKFEDREDQNIDWIQTPVQPVSADLDQNDVKALTEAIRWSIPSDNIKLKRWFNSFLRCSKIVEIADRANTTKQNVQKQFQRVIRRTHSILTKCRKAIDYNPSPLQFKKKIAEHLKKE